MHLFHFTACVCLPPILREGLSCYQYVACTTNGDWRNQRWDRGCGFDRTRIRITVDVDDALTSREFFKRYPTPTRIQRDVVPFEVRNDWYFVVGTIPPERFVSIELREDGDDYSPLSPFDLDALVECVEVEREASLRFAKLRTHTEIGLKEDVFQSWLVDGAGRSFGVNK